MGESPEGAHLTQLLRASCHDVVHDEHPECGALAGQGQEQSLGHITVAQVEDGQVGAARGERGGEVLEGWDALAPAGHGAGGVEEGSGGRTAGEAGHACACA